jgi:membrane protein DedA with SNARE-associated domain
MRTALEQYREHIALALRRFSLGLALGVLAIGLIVAVTHPDLANGVVALENRIQHQSGVQIAIAGIYLEESGLPMPVPSEVSVGYLGQRLTANPLALLASWLGLTVLIVLGSTNLFLASRRFGQRLLTGRLGTMLHLTPSRVARAQSWFGRWGPLAIGVSRYVPGLRWAMAAACGILGVGYRTFWFSTAISAALWAAVMLTLGVTVGDAVGQTIMAHAWIGLLLPLPAATVLTTGLVRLFVWRRAVTSVPAS